mmetsp:Transcript_17424/g.35988  ORF Transcript_17424/g.35988 Transcript_17424/m.35988 type:complete len:159 (-) Transcript_17424:1325-1801(-)
MSSTESTLKFCPSLASKLPRFSLLLCANRLRSSLRDHNSTSTLASVDWCSLGGTPLLARKTVLDFSKFFDFILDCSLVVIPSFRAPVGYVWRVRSVGEIHGEKRVQLPLHGKRVEHGLAKMLDVAFAGRPSSNGACSCVEHMPKYILHVLRRFSDDAA